MFLTNGGMILHFPRIFPLMYLSQKPSKASHIGWADGSVPRGSPAAGPRVDPTSGSIFQLLRADRGKKGFC